MIEKPNPAVTRTAASDDVLSEVLRAVRLTGALQFCLMPSGDWQTDAETRMASLSKGTSATIPFHIMIEGTCWLRIEGSERDLQAGDVVAFPFATAHQLGVGNGGRLIDPTVDLSPRPWRELPVLRYGGGTVGVRLLCGFLQCDVVNFLPLRSALPSLLHVRTAGANDAQWLGATIRQIVIEADQPRSGSLSLLERLTEVMFIELLRHQIVAAAPGSVGWLAALADPVLGRCLSLVHDDPGREWSLRDLSVHAGVSRSTLAERFESVLGTSPMRYVRDWRLYLACVALATTTRSIAGIADDAGYGAEAAFNRAFSRAYGMPPAAWRHNARNPGAESAGA